MRLGGLGGVGNLGLLDLGVGRLLGRRLGLRLLVRDGLAAIGRGCTALVLERGGLARFLLEVLLPARIDRLRILEIGLSHLVDQPRVGTECVIGFNSRHLCVWLCHNPFVSGFPQAPAAAVL